MENKVTLKARRKKHWKKIALIFGSGIAMIGTGILIAHKTKNGESLELCLEETEANRDGVNYIFEALWDNSILWDGMKRIRTTSPMSLEDLNEMFTQMNPDVYGVSEQTKWDEIIFIRK